MPHGASRDFLLGVARGGSDGDVRARAYGASSYFVTHAALPTS